MRLNCTQANSIPFHPLRSTGSRQAMMAPSSPSFRVRAATSSISSPIRVLCGCHKSAKHNPTCFAQEKRLVTKRLMKHTMDILRVTQSLRSVADQVYHAWPMMQWQKVAGPGPEIVTQKGREPFAGLALAPGQDLTLRCQLAFPATVAGVPLAGDALELTIFSIYPLDLSWNGTPIFTDEHAPVAAGPALVRVLPELQEADNGELLAHLHVPQNQVYTWLHFYFTTPRLLARFERFDVAWA